MSDITNAHTWNSDSNYHLAYSRKAFSPESILSGWMIVSGVLLTTSLLFYNMSRSNSKNVSSYLTKGISIGLIIISTLYMCFALYPYNKRMNFALKECYKHTRCSDNQVRDIHILKYSYTILGLLTVLIKSAIVYFVVVNI